MVGGDVERLEVVPVVLDLGAVLDREPGAAEERDRAAPRAGDRVQPARGLAASRLRDVDAIGGESPRELGPLEVDAPRFERRGDLVPERIDARARSLALGGIERRQRLELRRDGALLAEQLDLELLEVRQAPARNRSKFGSEPNFLPFQTSS